MAYTLTNSGRRAIVQATGTSGDTFAAFTGTVTESAELDPSKPANAVWNALINGTQSLVSGEVRQVRITSTHVLYSSSVEGE